MIRRGQMRSLPFALLVACQTDHEAMLLYSCPFSEVGPVAADDPGELGFTAADVLVAASASSSGVGSTDLATETYPVALTHTFELAGDPTVIEFDGSGFGDCPIGRALRVPATYTLAGAIGEWSVSVTKEHRAMVAVAADLGSISTDGSDAPPEGDPRDDATVASGLEDWVRAHAPGHVVDAATCAMGFELKPYPRYLTAGAWAQELAEGGALGARCDGDSWGALRWRDVEIQPLE